MDARYRYGHRPGRRRRTRVLIIFVISMLIFGSIAAIVYLDVKKNQGQPVAGQTNVVVQALDDNTNRLTIDQPTYTIELPADWKQIDKQNTVNEISTTWQAGRKNADNRYLKIYVDKFPADKPINRLVPVSIDPAKGGLVVGEVSPGCHTFTQGSSQRAGEAQALSYAPAKYQTIDFICNRALINQGETGAGSKDGINTVIVKGPASGTHKYFFLYTDHNIQPDYSIFYNALKSFKAK